jgi:Multidrug resistance efflux pump
MEKRLFYRIFLLLLFPLLAVSCSGDKNKDGQNRGSGGQTIIETGELAAVNSEAFVLPRYSRYFYEMRVIDIMEHGTLVNPGDTIIRLDPSDIQRFILERETSLETQIASLEKMYVDQENTQGEYETNIRNETATFELKKIELESSRFETERIRQIKKLEFDQAVITRSKEEQKRELNKVINQNNLRIQEIRVQQIRNELEDAKKILPRLTITTPIQGVFQVAENMRTRSLMKVGDNIYPGMKMANVPDLEWMKVTTYINETDFMKIHTGQKVAVRLDALPNVVFDGKISYIGKLCHKKDEESRQKVFDVEVDILKPDERLKPGMTVSCEFLDIR